MGLNEKQMRKWNFEMERGRDEETGKKVGERRSECQERQRVM